mgnify:CR=1 FL=1
MGYAIYDSSRHSKRRTIMIKDIITLLKINKFAGESVYIDIAKGKYKTPKNIKDVFIQFKRKLAWQTKK